MCGVDEYGFVTTPAYRFEDGKLSKDICNISALDEAYCVIAPSNVDLEKLYSEHSEDIGYPIANCRIAGVLGTATLADITHQELSGVQSIGPLISTVPSANRDSGKRLVMTVSAQRQAIPTWKRERPYVTTGVDALCEIGVTTAKTYASQYLESIGESASKLSDDVKVYLGSISDIGNKLDVNLMFTLNEKKYHTVYTLYNACGTVVGALKRTNLAVPKHEDADGRYYAAEDILFYRSDVDVNKAALSKNEISMGNIKLKSDSAAEHSVALGANVKVLFKSLAGYSYEDSIIVSEGFLLRYGLAIVKTNTVSFTLPKDAEVGADPQRIEYMPQLDATGYPKKGFYVQTGQEVLSVRSVDLSGCEKYRALTLDVGESGFILSYRVINKGNDKIVKIDLGEISPIDVGDKLEGLHGNKGVIGRILPEHEMMFTEDGEIPDIILNPLGVIARLNLGQMVEFTLGAIAEETGEIQVLEPFAEDSVESIAERAAQLGLVEKTIYDGRTGLPFDRKAMFGNMYILRLMHTSTSKYNATGNCNSNISARTLQPMRCAGGGQRMSELCTWCLVSYNATETLNSLFTVQSDSFNDKRNLDSAIKHGLSTDIEYNSNNIDILKAYFYMLGANISVDMNGVMTMELATDDFIRSLAGDHICRIEELKSGASTPKSILHDPRVFPETSDVISNRKQFGYLPFNCEMIMPLFLSSKQVAGLFAYIPYDVKLQNRVYTDGDVKIATTQVLSSIISGSKVILDWVELTTQEYHKEAVFKEYGVTLPDTYAVPVILDLVKSKTTVNSDIMLNDTGIRAVVGLFKRYNLMDTLCFPKVLENLDAVANLLLFSRSYKLSDFIVRGMLIPPVGYRPVAEKDSKSSNPIDAVLVKITGQIKMLLNTNISDEQRRRYETVLYNVIHEKLVVNNDKDPDNPSVIRQLSDHKTGISLLRDTLLAKRIAYSGRSVISIEPDLEIGECGVPVVMLATIFEDHIAAAITSPDTNYILKHIGRLNGDMSHKFIRKANKYLAANNLRGFKTFCMSRISITPSEFFASISGECLRDEKPITTAYQLFEKCYSQLVSILEKLLEEYPVMPNREPSLHKFSIQGFKAKPVDSYTIQLHPAACHGYNADYDGDQMAVFFPMHKRARTEVKAKMLSNKNLIDPKDGSCIVALNQDIILGLYYATIHKNNELAYEPDEIAKFYDLPLFNGFHGNASHAVGVCEEIMQDIECGNIKVHDTIICSYDGRKYIGEAGRFVINSILPNAIGFTHNRLPVGAIKGKYAEAVEQFSSLKLSTDSVLSKRTIGDLERMVMDYFIDYSLQEDDYHDTLGCALNRIMYYGFKFADLSGITLSLHDFVKLPVKSLIKDKTTDAEQLSKDISDWYNLGCCSEDERDKANVDNWSSTTSNLKTQITSEFKAGNSFDRMSNIFMIVDSGARGDVSQLLTMSGLIGIVTNSSGKNIPTPIESSYIDGLDSASFFQNAATARRQVASAQLTTADAGTLTREYIYLNEHQHIRNDDERCGAESLWIDIDYDVEVPPEAVSMTLVTSEDELKNIDFSRFDNIEYLFFDPDGVRNLYISMMKKVAAIYDGTAVTEEFLSLIPKFKMTYFICRDVNNEYHCFNPIVHMSAISKSQLLYRVLDMQRDKYIAPLVAPLAFDYLGGKPANLGDDIVIGEKIIEILEFNMVARVPIYTIIGCKSNQGICRCCFGLKYDTMAFPDFGEAVGYQAVQAIGNPITQLILDSHKTEFVGGESTADKLTNILKSSFRREDIPESGKSSMPFATQDNLCAKFESVVTEKTDARGRTQSSIQRVVNLYKDDEVVQTVPYSHLTELNINSEGIYNTGDLLYKNLLGSSIYKYWMNTVEFTEIQKQVWKMLCYCFDNEFIYARHFELFTRSISEFGIAQSTDLDGGIIKGKVYLTTKLDSRGVAWEPSFVGIKDAIPNSDKVFAGIAHKHLAARLAAAIVTRTVNNPDSNIGKFLVGALDTTSHAVCTKSVFPVHPRNSSVEYTKPTEEVVEEVASAELIENPDIINVGVPQVSAVGMFDDVSDVYSTERVDRTGFFD